jgi:hypothetical protein
MEKEETGASLYERLIDLREKISKQQGKYDADLESQCVALIFAYGTMIQYQKSATYKDSWIKRGWGGAFHNIGRKFDRIETFFKDTKRLLKFEEETKPSLHEEPVLDTIIDLMNYSGLASQRIMITKPEIFDHWLERNGMYSGGKCVINAPIK